jgi:type II secretory pathway pseudopilin PulG
VKTSRQEAGFGLVETLVAVVILGITTIAALQMFSQFSRNFSSSRQRDAIATLITSDLAALRSELNVWKIGSDGSYAPPEAACGSNTLATAVRSDLPSPFPATTMITGGANTSGPLQGVQITRTITIPADNGNAFNVSYAAASGTSVEVNTSTTLVPPALAWCP